MDSLNSINPLYLYIGAGCAIASAGVIIYTIRELAKNRGNRKSRGGSLEQAAQQQTSEQSAQETQTYKMHAVENWAKQPSPEQPTPQTTPSKMDAEDGWIPPPPAPSQEDYRDEHGMGRP